MNITAVSAFAQIGASVAVLVTLIYLAIQVRQSAAIARSQSRQTQVGLDLELLKNVIELPEIAISHAQKGKLDNEAKVRLYYWLIAMMRSREHQWFQYLHGVIDEKSWESYRVAIRWVLNTERLRRYWQLIAEGFDPAFVSIVNEQIQSPPRTESFWNHPSLD